MQCLYVLTGACSATGCAESQCAEGRVVGVYVLAAGRGSAIIGSIIMYTYDYVCLCIPMLMYTYAYVSYKKVRLTVNHTNKITSILLHRNVKNIGNQKTILFETP